MKERRVLVVGLDCLTPQLVLDRWLDQLPTIKSLLGKSVYGPLKSCVPPITVPAWACMTTSKNPGALGIYGFRKNALLSFTSLKEGKLEKIEKLEQLRALEAGMRIKVKETEYDTFGIDTIEDLRKAEEWQNISL